jgi:hypothetical protein
MLCQLLKFLGAYAGLLLIRLSVIRVSTFLICCTYCTLPEWCLV